VKAIVRALGDSHSNLLEQRGKRQNAQKRCPSRNRPRVPKRMKRARAGCSGPHPRCSLGNAQVTGYPRVTALLNRERTERVNPKRINRIMRRNKLPGTLHGRWSGPKARRRHHHAETRLALVLR
jgi:hypothetical protein